MSPQIEFPSASVPPLVRDLGLMLGLLTPTDPPGNTLVFELSWIQQVLTNLEAIPTRRDQIMAVLRDLLAGQTPTALDGRDWYSLTLSGAASCLCVVLPTDDSGTSSIVGVGLLQPLPTGGRGTRPRPISRSSCWPTGTTRWSSPGSRWPARDIRWNWR